jgi:hypothetical protein
VAQTDFNFGFNALEGRENIPTYACMGNVVCSACNKHHGYCSELTAVQSDRQAEGKDMDLGTHYDNESKKGGGKGYKRRDFLKAVHIPAKGCVAKIIDFREAPKSMEYSDFLVDLALPGKKEYTWGLRSKSVTLNMLIDALGKRTEKWIGKTVKLVRGGPKQQYVNVGN